MRYAIIASVPGSVIFAIYLTGALLIPQNQGRFPPIAGAAAGEPGRRDFASKPDSVLVDPGGRVIGSESLYVADASLMPRLPTANTNDYHDR